jgi:hypothetical protein
MSRASVLVVLGILTLIVPFSGLPSLLRTGLTVLFGFCVFCIGLAERVRDVHAARAAAAARSEVLAKERAPEDDALVAAEIIEEHQSPQTFSPI